MFRIDMQSATSFGVEELGEFHETTTIFVVVFADKQILHMDNDAANGQGYNADI